MRESKEGTVQTTVRMPAPLMRRLKIQAVNEGCTLQSLMIEAVQALLAARKGAR